MSRRYRLEPPQTSTHRVRTSAKFALKRGRGAKRRMVGVLQKLQKTATDTPAPCSWPYLSPWNRLVMHKIRLLLLSRGAAKRTQLRFLDRDHSPTLSS
jgi:hypothetical protein